MICAAPNIDASGEGARRARVRPAKGDVDRNHDVGEIREVIVRKRIYRAPVDQQAAFALHRTKEARDRHRASDGRRKGARLKYGFVALRIIRRNDDRLDGEGVKVVWHAGRPEKLENNLGIEQHRIAAPSQQQIGETTELSPEATCPRHWSGFEELSGRGRVSRALPILRRRRPLRPRPSRSRQSPLDGSRVRRAPPERRRERCRARPRCQGRSQQSEILRPRRDHAAPSRAAPALASDGSPTDVSPTEPFRPVDAIDRGVGAGLRFAHSAAKRGHRQNPAAICDNCVADLPSARLQNRNAGNAFGLRNARDACPSKELVPDSLARP